MSPVSSMAIAALGPTALPRATPGVWQKRPMLTPGVEKLDSSEHTHKSAVATSYQRRRASSQMQCSLLLSTDLVGRNWVEGRGADAENGQG